jgi:peptide/nickel transport system substrate-binding protein
VAGLGALALALVAGACSSSGSTGSSGTAAKGGTAVMAEFPSSPPNYVFPFMNSTYASNSNIFDLQWLMYRPLYWFGTGAKPTLNPSLSLAYPATFNGTTVTVKLKHYMWSNGTQVTAQDVVLWLNMLLAVPQDWGLGTGFPQDVHDITVVSPTELTMVMNKAYSPTWFQYNELSQITPIPAAWDRTASGPSNCDTTVSDCAAVYNYLNKQAQDEAGYATSPIWQIVDGPWHLSAFSSDGHMTFVPNKKYSGPVKPKLAAFEEVPFTTDSAEYDVMQSPSATKAGRTPGTEGASRTISSLMPVRAVMNGGMASHGSTRVAKVPRHSPPRNLAAATSVRAQVSGPNPLVSTSMTQKVTSKRGRERSSDDAAVAKAMAREYVRGCSLTRIAWSPCPTIVTAAAPAAISPVST